LHESTKRRRIKINVIFNPYWILATCNKEITLNGVYYRRCGDKMEELTTPSQRKGEDEKAEYSHLEDK
jgi:hypothetical protein